jgi:hypothetical protein
MQNVWYKPGEDIRKALDKAFDKDSKLMAWFELNKRDKNAKEYYYFEIPEHYTWVPVVNKWKIREGGKKTIGRMYTVSHKQGELFYLRMLLIDVKGAESWEDLCRDKDDPDVIYDTFEEAADKRDC